MTFLRFIPETTNVDFVRYRFLAFAVDGLLMLASIMSIAWAGFNLGIDFTGGVLMELKLEQPARSRAIPPAAALASLRTFEPSEWHPTVATVNPYSGSRNAKPRNIPASYRLMTQLSR